MCPDGQHHPTGGRRNIGRRIDPLISPVELVLGPGFERGTPLWYYVLAESSRVENGRPLGSSRCGPERPGAGRSQTGSGRSALATDPPVCLGSHCTGCVAVADIMREDPGLGRDGLVEHLSFGPLGLLVFVVDGHRLAVDLAIVDRAVAMVAITPLAGAPDVILGAVDVAGAVVPVYDLRRRLGLPAREYGADAVLVLARTVRRPVAVAADEVVGVRDVDGGSLAVAGGLPDGMRHAAGTAALDDGVVVIHDLDAFLSDEEEGVLAPALAEAIRDGG